MTLGYLAKFPKIYSALHIKKDRVKCIMVPAVYSLGLESWLYCFPYMCRHRSCVIPVLLQKRKGTVPVTLNEHPDNCVM